MINRIIRDNEEKVLREVLRQVLKREPELADAKECTKCYMPGEPFNYILAYKGQALGCVKFNLPLGRAIDFSIVFEPDPAFK